VNDIRRVRTQSYLCFSRGPKQKKNGQVATRVNKLNLSEVFRAVGGCKIFADSVAGVSAGELLLPACSSEYRSRSNIFQAEDSKSHTHTHTPLYGSVYQDDPGETAVETNRGAARKFGMPLAFPFKPTVEKWTAKIERGQ